MVFYKSIIQGRLDFGTDKSYEKVTKMFQYRVETYYKNSLIFKYEDIFKDEFLTLEIPRFVGNVTEKSFKNTTDLLNYCAQFAVSGSVRSWLLENGEVLQFYLIEPQSDKGAVQSFLKGKNMIKIAGKTNEAFEELSKAIEKHDRHAMAYERRAKTCVLLKNYSDAIRDFTKSINIDPTMPSAYLGRGRVKMIQQDYQSAIQDFDHAIKKSVALESIHWKARRLKAHCHLKLKEYQPALFELRLFVNRKFAKDDINNEWKRWGWFKYGIALMETENYSEAIDAFNKAESLPEYRDGIKTSEIIFRRGLAKQKAGKSGYLKDLKEAADLGMPEAQALLTMD